MAVEMMAMAGVPPPQTAPPGVAASPTGPPEGGGGFAGVIAAALAAGPPGEAPPAGAGLDLAALLASLTAPPGGEAATQMPVPEGPRLDRDAGAGIAEEALASLLLGALLRPAVAVPPPEAPVVSAPVAAAAALPPAVAGAAVAAVVAAAVAPVPEAAGPAEAVAEPAAFALPAASSVADAPAAYAAPAVWPPAGDRATAAASPAPLPDAVATAPGAQPVVVATPVLAAPAASAPAATEATASAATHPVALTDVQPVARRADDPAAVAVSADGPRPAVHLAAVGEPSAPAVVAVPDGPALASAVANSVQQATLRGERELSLSLNPPDLGQLTVRITEHESGTVSVSIHATSSEAHDLLQQQLPALRSGLEQRDVRVEQLRVDQQTPSAGPGWADGGGRESRGRRDGWDDRQPAWLPLASLRRAAQAALPAGTIAAAHVGAVDVRA